MNKKITAIGTPIKYLIFLFEIGGKKSKPIINIKIIRNGTNKEAISITKK
jgi:hypothetical protein